MDFPIEQAYSNLLRFSYTSLDRIVILRAKKFEIAAQHRPRADAGDVRRTGPAGPRSSGAKPRRMDRHSAPWKIAGLPLY